LPEFAVNSKLIGWIEPYLNTFPGMLDGRTCADSLWVVHYYSNPLAEFGCFGTLSDQQKLQQDPHGIRQL
jgi:hypothetical protein